MSAKMEKIKRIVMVCTGNTCRSPMAWGIGKREAERRKMAVEIDSAGTCVSGQCAPCANAVAACAEIGIDISSQLSTQAGPELYTPETLFAVMTASHAQWLTAVLGIPAESIVILGCGIPDPYGGSLEAYRAARDAIEAALMQLFDQIAPLTDHADGLLLRPARASDIAAIAATELESFTDPWTAEGFAAELDNSHSCLLAAECDGRICGYAVMYCVLETAELPKICVAPEYRRQGIGAAMLERLSQRAAAGGCTGLSLEVRQSNLAARALYESQGFENVGIRPSFYRNPTEDAVIMTKPLT